MKLKPCPFCGSEDIIEDAVDGFWLSETEFLDETECWVICDGCGAKTYEFHTMQEAVDAWNRRIRPGPDG